MPSRSKNGDKTWEISEQFNTSQTILYHAICYISYSIRMFLSIFLPYERLILWICVRNSVLCDISGSYTACLRPSVLAVCHLFGTKHLSPLENQHHFSKAPSSISRLKNVLASVPLFFPSHIFSIPSLRLLNKSIVSMAKQGKYELIKRYDTIGFVYPAYW
jgi:hypothetical protein